MKKILVSLFVFLPAVAFADPWHLIKNEACGYQLVYPGPARPIPVAQWKGSYLDPLAALGKIKIDKQCSLKIPLPIYEHNTNLTEKSLYFLALENYKKPLPGKKVTYGDYVFYQSHASDASMCHDLSVDYYFTKYQQQVYVLAFVFNSVCVGVQPGADKLFDKDQEDLHEQHILTHTEFMRH